MVKRVIFLYFAAVLVASAVQASQPEMAARSRERRSEWFSGLKNQFKSFLDSMKKQADQWGQSALDIYNNITEGASKLDWEYPQQNVYITENNVTFPVFI